MINIVLEVRVEGPANEILITIQFEPKPIGEAYEHDAQFMFLQRMIRALVYRTDAFQLGPVLILAISLDQQVPDSVERRVENDQPFERSVLASMFDQNNARLLKIGDHVGRKARQHVVGRHMVGRHVVGRHVVGRHVVGRHVVGRHVVGGSVVRSDDFAS
ncbi:MAG TPA: hypothetical protein EYQ60_11935 [Myxococcales bacterium]|nr:hypothetical protein [Myxococcales bacterium]